MIKIPEWLAKLPKGACVNYQEFSQLLGIKAGTLRDRVSNGTYSTPKPDFNSKVYQKDKLGRLHLRSGVSKGRGKNHWRAVTVRNHIRHLNRLELEKMKASLKGRLK